MGAGAGAGASWLVAQFPAPLGSRQGVGRGVPVAPADASNRAGASGLVAQFPAPLGSRRAVGRRVPVAPADASTVRVRPGWSRSSPRPWGVAGALAEGCRSRLPMYRPCGCVRAGRAVPRGPRESPGRWPRGAGRACRCIDRAGASGPVAQFPAALGSRRAVRRGVPVAPADASTVRARPGRSRSSPRPSGNRRARRLRDCRLRTRSPRPSERVRRGGIWSARPGRSRPGRAERGPGSSPSRSRRRVPGRSDGPPARPARPAGGPSRRAGRPAGRR